MSADPERWQQTTAHPDLSAVDVHIWRSRLDVSAQALEAYRQILSADERERAQRFVFAPDRRRSLVTRAILRSLLAAYTGWAAHELAFGSEPAGKPYLARPHDTNLAFNLSHTGAWVVYGFCRRGRIGIDIEQQCDRRDIAQMAAHVFSAHELAVWHSLPTQQRAAAFYAGWTRKEAFLKATGAGLSFPLARVVVSLAPAEPPRLLYVGDDSAEAQRWHMAAFSPAPTITGTVALDEQPAALSFWQVLAVEEGEA